MKQDVDSRLVNRIAEARAAAAVLDDCRCGLVEMIEEGPRFPDAVLVGLDANRDAVNALAVKVDAIAANLERIRQQLHQEQTA